ncbi:DinB family protein [Rhodococcus sp. (in: high G+C Gram-positive bacteria)]|uniref:DinB family protein n=1 Tax=Rhodococcus sp. TaxID=1831 RepID=UPI00388F589F
MSQNTVTGEHADILEMLAEQREMFLITVRGINDEQARTRSTVSDLTLGGLVKHVADTERSWIETIREMDENAEVDMDAQMEQYFMRDDESLADLLESYRAIADATEEYVATLDLNRQVPLPIAPWSPTREWMSARKILIHIIRETAHHSGHADIIRESLDGANTTRQRGEDAGMEFD